MKRESTSQEDIPKLRIIEGGKEESILDSLTERDKQTINELGLNFNEKGEPDPEGQKIWYDETKTGRGGRKKEWTVLRLLVKREGEHFFAALQVQEEDKIKGQRVIRKKEWPLSNVWLKKYEA